MENHAQELPLELTESNDYQGLWLTDQLLAQLRTSAKAGWPLMIFSILLGISGLLLSIYSLHLTWLVSPLKEFYLLEGDTLFRTLNLLTIAAMYYFFFRGTTEGYKAWRLLRFCETNDDALLEGTERLGKMFRWLTLWGAIYMGTLVLQTLWHNVI